jgi:hypothetical protein
MRVTKIEVGGLIPDVRMTPLKRDPPSAGGAVYSSSGLKIILVNLIEIIFSNMGTMVNALIPAHYPRINICKRRGENEVTSEVSVIPKSNHGVSLKYLYTL